MQKPQNSGKEHLSIPVKDSWKMDVLWEHIIRTKMSFEQASLTSHIYSFINDIQDARAH